VNSAFSGVLDKHKQRLADQLSLLSARSASELSTLPGALQDLSRAGDYLFGQGGKRVRPILVYLAEQAVGGLASVNPNADPIACAIELIHTYSLIHDDLPAMDDDDLRRGKPTLHKAYDEATAILVGDGLQARAFELIADAPDLTADQKVRIIKVLAEASGLQGMVGGQYIDISSTGMELDLEQLQAMHALKTGALIRAALAMGGIAAGATNEQLESLDEYGVHIGLAFQVVDDVLDVESDTATLGKTQGKDGAANKATYVKLMGLEGAKAEAQRLLQAALAALEGFGDSADHLRDLARYIVERDH
jgi:farnesyl diphosphate synthase/geranylgeranyl diphosphate synthase type II